MSNDVQVWKVPVTPAQRFIMINLAHGQEQRIKGGSAGRQFRRFMRAFGLDRIRDALRAHDNKCNGKRATSDAPSLFEITAENAEQALKLAENERLPGDEMVMGPLFDLLEDLKGGKDVAVPAANVPVFDPATDDWAPMEERDLVDDAVEKICQALVAGGFSDAATLVQLGSWESVALAPHDQRVHGENAVTPATSSA